MLEGRLLLWSAASQVTTRKQSRSTSPHLAFYPGIACASRRLPGHASTSYLGLLQSGGAKGGRLKALASQQPTGKKGGEGGGALNLFAMDY